MMEKVTIVISKSVGACREADQWGHVQFLQTALKISTARSIYLNKQLDRQVRGGGGSYTKLTIDVNHEQLGGYTALRRRPVDLMKCWKHPEILEHEFGCPQPRPCDQPIELRPTHRRIP